MFPIFRQILADIETELNAIYPFYPTCTCSQLNSTMVKSNASSSCPAHLHIYFDGLWKLALIHPVNLDHVALPVIFSRKRFSSVP